MVSKPALTLDEQIIHLKQKKLIFSSEEKAKKVLNQVSYQKLFLYRFLFEEDGYFLDGTKFEDVCEVYFFDKKISSLFFDVLLTVEIMIKTRLSYYLAHKYGVHGYMNSDNFRDKKYHQNFLKDIQNEVLKNKNKSIVIKKHAEKYDYELPIYKLVEILTFGTISRLFSNLKIEDKKAISKEYFNSIDVQILKSWIITLVDIRNSCAHNNPLFFRKLLFPPKRINCEKWDEYSDDKLKNIFGSILVLKELLMEIDEWNEFRIKLEKVINSQKHKKKIERYMGLPKDWKNKI